MRTSLADLIKLLSDSAAGSYFKPKFEDTKVCQFWYRRFGDFDLTVVEQALQKLEGDKDFPTPKELLEQIQTNSQYSKLKALLSDEIQPQNTRMQLINEIKTHPSVRALNEADQRSIEIELDSYRMPLDKLLRYGGNIQQLIYEICPYLDKAKYKRPTWEQIRAELRKVGITKEYNN